MSEDSVMVVYYRGKIDMTHACTPRKNLENHLAHYSKFGYSKHVVLELDDYFRRFDKGEFTLGRPRNEEVPSNPRKKGRKPRSGS